jgi:hypothetical protein
LYVNRERLKQLLQEKFTEVPDRHRGDEFCIICPDCGDDRSGHRSINLRTGLTNCFLCNRGGHIDSWLKKHGVEPDDDFGVNEGRHDWTLAIEKLVYGQRRRVSYGSADPKLPKGFTPLAQERLPRGRKPNIYYTLIAAMAERKRLDVDDFIEAGAGYTMDDAKWEPYCIFPVIEWDTARYYQGRTYCDEPDRPTKRFPGKTLFPEGSVGHLYGYDDVRLPGTRCVVLVESILNALSLKKKFRQQGVQGTVPACCWQRSVSHGQWITLLKQQGHIEEVCIFFDHDATAKAWDAADKALKRYCPRFRVSIAEMPPTCGHTTDPNDDIDTAFQAFTARKRFSKLGHAGVLLSR